MDEFLEVFGGMRLGTEVLLICCLYLYVEDIQEGRGVFQG